MKLSFIILLGVSFVSAQKSIDQNLKINQIQVIGSHNSYKKAIEPQVYDYLSQKDSLHFLPKIQYEHIPIEDQLNLGLRNIEIDVSADSKGRKYAKPKILDVVKIDHKYDLDGKMLKPGFKMIHIPDVDFESWFYTFSDCLDALKIWSEKHPDHDPIFITLEPKEGTTNQFGTTPELFTAELFDALDLEIVQHLGRKHLIVPDDIRGKYSTLREAVLNNNWPNLKDAKGKFFFILDNNGATRDLYIKNHPSLKGRMIFTNSEANQPEAAAMIINDPTDAKIKDLVLKGFIIRTRADADTQEARNEDYSRFENAKKSGAQIITTDYYYPSKLFKSSYKIDFEGNSYERENPLNHNKK